MMALREKGANFNSQIKKTAIWVYFWQTNLRIDNLKLFVGYNTFELRKTDVGKYCCDIEKWFALGRHYTSLPSGWVEFSGRGSRIRALKITRFPANRVLASNKVRYRTIHHISESRPWYLFSQLTSQQILLHNDIPDGSWKEAHRVNLDYFVVEIDTTRNQQTATAHVLL